VVPETFLFRLQHNVDGLFDGPDLAEHPYEIKSGKWGAGFGFFQFVLSHAKVLSSEGQVLNGTLVSRVALIDYIRVGVSSSVLSRHGQQATNSQSPSVKIHKGPSFHQ
jgi:hypothetical protein